MKMLCQQVLPNCNGWILYNVGERKLLTLVCPDVTAPRLMRIWPRHAALVGCQNAAEPIPAAALVAGVDCGATGAKRHRQRRPAIVAQRLEFWIDAVHIAGTLEVARPVAAQVETFCLERSATAILRIVVGNDGILHVDRQTGIVVNAPAGGPSETGGVSADRSVVDLRTPDQTNELPVVYCTSDSARRGIAGERAVRDVQGPIVEDGTSAARLEGGIAVEGTSDDGKYAAVADRAAYFRRVVADRAVDDRSRATLAVIHRSAVAVETRAADAISFDEHIFERQPTIAMVDGTAVAAAAAVTHRHPGNSDVDVFERDEELASAPFPVDNRITVSGAVDTNAVVNRDIFRV